MGTQLKEIHELRYGENGQQRGWIDHSSEKLLSDPLAIGNFELAQGDIPGYNNITDLDRSLQTMTHIAANFDRNTASVPLVALGVKHGNPCGAAYSEEDPLEATQKMLDGNPISIFGGAIMLNYPLTGEVAEQIIHHNMGQSKRIIDTVMAPSFNDDARPYLERKESVVRVLTNPALAELTEDSLDANVRDRYIRGGHLVQDNYTDVFDWDETEQKAFSVAARPGLTLEQERWVLLGWAVCSTSNSNTVTLVKDGMLIGNGVGQQDRVGAAELALKLTKSSGHDIEGSIACSDSFFPFPDGPETLLDAGVKGIVATEGSIRFKEIQDLMLSKFIPFYTRPDKSGRGFYAH